MEITNASNTKKNVGRSWDSLGNILSIMHLMACYSCAVLIGTYETKCGFVITLLRNKNKNYRIVIIIVLYIALPQN